VLGCGTPVPDCRGYGGERVLAVPHLEGNILSDKFATK
jgi:hypothetical protein